MTNINISIPDDLHRKLKYAALLADKPLKDLVIDILHEPEHRTP